MNRLARSAVLDLLRAHCPYDMTEAAFVRSTMAFVASTVDFATRSHPAGHLTASGWIVNETRTHALLIHHAKLNRWLQPGGHIEATDESLMGAAMREVCEETGLSDILPVSASLFDVDIHAIPARNNEPEHRHYDCRFLFQASASAAITISEESAGYEWLALDELINSACLTSLQRMALKSQSL